ncbi:MAG: hypothetical protein V1918_08535 [Planctomycetota bacterium]
MVTVYEPAPNAPASSFSGILFAWMGGALAMLVILTLALLLYQVDSLQQQIRRLQADVEGIRTQLAQAQRPAVAPTAAAAIPAEKPSPASLAQPSQNPPDRAEAASSPTEGEKPSPEPTLIAAEPAAPLFPAGAQGKGRVLSVDPRQMRVMLSIGADQGLTRGQRYLLCRNGGYVGEVRVRDVYADMSACEILFNGDIRTNDVVFEPSPEAEALASRAQGGAFQPTHSFAREDTEGGSHVPR